MDVGVVIEQETYEVMISPISVVHRHEPRRLQDLTASGAVFLHFRNMVA